MRGPVRSWQAWVWWVGWCVAGVLQGGEGPPLPDPDWDSLSVPAIRVVLGDEGIRQLGEYPRRWVAGQVEIERFPPCPVRVRIKGRHGSFQEIHRSPSLTVVAAEGSIPLFGGNRLHLENAAEDPGRLNAAFGAEAFRRLGVEPPRVGWGRVHINGRERGWYVVREGFTPAYARRVGFSKGTLLAEPEPGTDIGGGLDFKGDPDPAAATAAAAAWAGIAAGVRGAVGAAAGPSGVGFPGVDWVRFDLAMAGEVIVGHRDGYALARNNYRVAFGPDGVAWIPYGMDQLLVGSRYPVFPRLNGELAQARFPEGVQGRRRWAVALGQALDRLGDEGSWDAWLSRVQARLEPGLKWGERRALRRSVEELRRQWGERLGFVRREMADAERVLSWDGGFLRVEGWERDGGTRPGEATLVAEGDGGQALWVRAGPGRVAGWRRWLWLPPGTYRFEGRIRTKGVLTSGKDGGSGAALRVLGNGHRTGGIPGDSDWQAAQVDFRVASPGGDVALVCELRGTTGEAWFDVGSLQLARIE